MILNKELYRHHGYLRGLFLALKITFFNLAKNLFGLEKRMTLNYPEEKYFYSDRFKGKHILTVKEDGTLRCTSCMLCATACPADCIHIEASNNDDWRVEKAPVSFRIEILRCVFCGMCEEACPVDAIRLGPEYELANHAESEWILDQHNLAYRTGLNAGKGVLSRVNDENRLSLRL